MQYIWLVRLFLAGLVVGEAVMIGPSEPCHGTWGGEPVYTCESYPIDIFLGEHTECYYIYGWECP